MVEQRTLNPSVVVRIHLPQLRGREVVVNATAFFYTLGIGDDLEEKVLCGR